MTDPTPPIPTPVTLAIPLGGTRHHIHYEGEQVTFRQHQETDLAFLAALDSPVPCACIEIYRDLLTGYRTFPGPRMPSRCARHLLDTHAAPILTRLTAAGFRVTRRYDQRPGLIPRLLFYAPDDVPVSPAFSDSYVLAEISGDGLFLYRDHVARVARGPGWRSTQRIAVSPLIGSGPTCRPCGFRGRTRTLRTHLETVEHRRRVWDAFTDAFPMWRIVL